ncbi:threonine transporter (plasmid) [Mycolicibacterium arabiense]|uniref:Threonine transporter n=1 Tax=Mycolicibacterium arabiense TaxID=1286181 RepID=A0A7I7RR40_9MYCO|nr:LysE family transporter [Mycolicibacterium arabiense]MCV7371998.1 LysE family transporter [Mycolicibacterium arabiense]BBY46681.1 threonine transporter [Mycolicibacterium arabiense]
MNPNVLSLITITGAIAIGAISPGPSFVMVAQTSLATEPRNGRIAALGIGVGGLMFAVTATAGLGAALVYAGPLFMAVKIAGGAYLVYLGIRLWLASIRDDSTEEGSRAVASTRTFTTALLTQLSNPKAIVVYGSVFASALPLHPSHWLLLALPLAVAGVELSWYLIVATVMSRPGPKRVYSRAGRTLDRVAGTAMGGLGAVFVVEGARASLR